MKPITPVNTSSLDWGDYDSDGDLDLAVSGDESLFADQKEPSARIYRNDDGSFTDIEADLPGAVYGRLDWGDYDNDGDLDLAMSEGARENNRARIYRNDDGAFTDIQAGLPSISWGPLAWKDYDGDGDLDLLAAGGLTERLDAVFRNENGRFVEADTGINLNTSGLVYTDWGDYDKDGDQDLIVRKEGDLILYRNDEGAFSEANAGLENVRIKPIPIGGSVQWGDYDADGDLDVLAHNVASRDTSLYESRIYRNDGGTFSDIGADFDLGQNTDGNWSDYDGDGDLDVFVSTYDENHLYRNEGGSFTEANVGFPEDGAFTAAWGDYDGDGDLDAAMQHENAGDTAYVHIYRNDAEFPNSAPGAPAALTTDSVTYRRAALSWQAATDDATPQEALSYNVRVGTASGKGDVVAPMAILTGADEGRRTVVGPGNAGQRTRMTLKDLEANTTYYWSVQAVDNGFAGGGFAPEGQFRTEEAPAQFVAMDATLPAISQGDLAWGDYDADGDLDLVIAGLLDGTPVTRLYENTDGSFAAAENDLVGVYDGSVAWGDYDADGDLDLLVTGRDVNSERSARIYRNDDGAFTNIEAGLTGTDKGEAAWGDWNNDGALDLALTGVVEASSTARVYKQSEPGIFEPIRASITGAYESAVSWSDYDDDGDSDLLITGRDADFDPSARIYRNEDDLLVDIEADLVGVRKSAAAWGDYDADGDQDVAIAGEDAEGNAVTNLYRNNEGAFSKVDADLAGGKSGAVAWGDVDNDGDLDLLTAGQGSTATTRLYRNEGGSFVNAQAQLGGAGARAAAWGDQDGDGDLDLALMSDSAQTRLLQNGSKQANHPPRAPGALSAVQPRFDRVNLSWKPATDDATPQEALSYNVRVGTAPGKSDVLSSMTAGTQSKWRLLARNGNAGQRSQMRLAGLEQGTTYYWSVQTIDNSFVGSAFSEEQSFTTSPVANEETPTSPGAFTLGANRPNPFRTATSFQLTLPRSSQVRLVIYDVLGRRVTTLVDEPRPAGRYEVTWTPDAGLPSGTYFCRFEAGGTVSTRTISLLR